MGKLPPGEGPRPEGESSIKQKLANIEKYLPGQTDLTYDFAHFLAERSDESMVPGGFDMMAELAMADLQRGNDGYNGQPLKNKLVGYPPTIYVQLRMVLPKIKKAVLESTGS